MSGAAASRLGRRGRLALLGLAAGLALLVAGANAHLLHVSLASHPGCAPHRAAPGGEEGALRAARSAC